MDAVVQKRVPWQGEREHEESGVCHKPYHSHNHNHNVNSFNTTNSSLVRVTNDNSTYLL